MPDKLDPSPAKTKLVTIDEYRALVEDHPVKFSAEQVGFKKGDDQTDSVNVCGSCFHYYRGMYHNVCEIFRPTDGELIAPLDQCKFWSNDGENFPLLDQ